MKGTRHVPKDDDLIEIIQFVTWLRLECDFNSIYLWDYKGEDLTLKELFTIYKQKYEQ
jgi:hypothetical protein